MRDDKEALFERFFAMVDNTITRIADESITNDDKALMERLRATWANSHNTPWNPDGQEAADRIAALRAEVGQARLEERAKIVAWLRDIENQNIIINTTMAMNNNEVRVTLNKAAEIFGKGSHLK